MDQYGLTDTERNTNLHNYNHALFRNMMYFLNFEWEINILTRTVFVFEDKNEPGRDEQQIAYSELYQDYLDKYIEESEIETFQRYLAFENLVDLKEEVTFDIHLKIRDESELHNIILTPAFDESGQLYSVYLGARNLQEEVRRELEEYRRYEKFLSAILSNSYFHLSFDLTEECMITEDFVAKDGRHLISELTRMDAPVPYDYFIQKWNEAFEPQFEKEEDRYLFRADSLKKLYEKNEHLVELEIKQKNPDGGELDCIMQVFIVLMARPEDKSVCVYIILKDISVFQRQTMRDNMELMSSNENLRNSLSQEQQFRLASLSGALLVYNINLTKNQLEEEFYEIVDNQRIPMLEMFGLTAPCDFGEFCRKWCETKVPQESRETFLSMFNREYMLEEYEKGERHLEIEFDTVLGRGIRITLRNTAFLVQDQTSGDILAMVNGKDVSKQREEEKRQRETLRDAYEAANTANTVKTDFLTRMSHDIRTPMNSIIGMTSIASKHLDNEKRVSDCLREINKSGKYLLSILTEVLDMSKIESGKLELEEEEFDLTAMMENIGMIADVQSREKEHNFTVSMQGLKHGRVFGDPDRLQQVLMNLIDNSFKYTPENGRIKLVMTEKETGEEDRACFEFMVEDNGIGMEQDYLLHIFEPFVRSEDRRVSKIQGIGLGMPIAKNIVQMMDGKIEVQSELNRGTKITATVYLALPQ